MSRAVSACIDFFFPRLISSGALIFDDYGWKGCPGVIRAVQEFKDRTGHDVLLTARYQCALVKLPATASETHAPKAQAATRKAHTRED